MYCTDFVFNGERLSDHNLMICNFDGSESTQNGGDVTFITVKPPYSDKHTYYTYSYETPISLTFSICKNPCKTTDEDMCLNQDEQSYLKRWLQRADGYYWLAFDQDGFEDVWFNSKFNLQPHFIDGRVVGYDVTVDTDSPYGYSQENKNEFSIKVGDSYKIIDYSDSVGSIYPKTQINVLPITNKYVYEGSFQVNLTVYKIFTTGSDTKESRKKDNGFYLEKRGQIYEPHRVKLKGNKSHSYRFIQYYYYNGELREYEYDFSGEIHISVDEDAEFSTNMPVFNTEDTECIDAYRENGDITGAINYEELASTMPLEVSLITGCEDNNKTTVINNAIQGNEIVLNGNNDYIDGIANLNNFNFIFPEISNSYSSNSKSDLGRVNNITNNGDCDLLINMSYRYIRRVDV